jgi:hypothetical protein
LQRIDHNLGSIKKHSATENTELTEKNTTG